MKKRIVPMLLALLLIVAAAAFSIQAADTDPAQAAQQVIADAAALEGSFPTSGNYTAVCPVCGTSQTWKPLTTNKSSNISDGDHYYMPASFENQYQIFLIQNGKKICVHTNGQTLTGKGRFCLVNGGSELNIMGSGTLQSELTSTTMGVLYANSAGTINVYGTTIKSTSTAGHSAICLYKNGGIANVYGSTLIAENSPTVITNGTVNLYDCTVTGESAEVGGAVGDDGTNGKLNLVDTAITGVNAPKGAVTVSGETKITGAGLVLAEGMTVDPSGLTDGASVSISASGVFTGSGMAAYAGYFAPVNEDYIIVADAGGALSCVPEGAVLVGTDGSITVAEDILAQWQTGGYAYIKLYADETLEDLGGTQVYVDLNGNDLTVGGAGMLYAFDSANDTYDASACGTVTNNGTVEIAADVAAPNGKHYIAITDGTTTMHRLDARVSAVTLRTAAAGLYYKAVYYCDDLLSTKVKDYGVVLSVDNMPGSDFLNEAGGDINLYTESATAFESGVTATSGSVFGIMKTGREAAENALYGEMEIYANAYIRLAGDLIVVGDDENAGKTSSDEGFTGTAWSLYEVLDAIDGNYYDYSASVRKQVDKFRADWNGSGMDNWRFLHIDEGVDNSDLVFDADTSDAFCPVCREKVTWTALTDEANKHNVSGHYYLTKDLTYTGDPTDGFIYNGTKNTTLCLHLNGHNITATQTRAFFGSSGVLNVMGNGIVTGYNKSGAGAALQINNTLATNGVNLYGGTWKKADNVSAKVAALGISTVGGKLMVYEGAAIEAADDMAVQIMTPGYRNAELGLYGCTVNGDVVLAGADPAKNFTSTAELVDCKVNGNVDVALYNDVSLAGVPVITSITRHEDLRLHIERLGAGASIGMATDGVFSTETENAASYTSYFHSTNAAGKITVRDDALHCGNDYTGDLEFIDGTENAMCPVCGEVVTWTPVDGTTQIVNTAANHYYLTQDATFTAANGETSFLSPGHGDYSVCFHLNGHDFTATNTRFVYGGTSITNIMGTGTVTGSRSDVHTCGSTVQINVGNERGTVNLYGGTWKQAEGGKYANDYVISISDNGGTVNIHEGATVEANSNAKAVYVGTCGLRTSKLGIYGTVKGSVYAAGAKTEALGSYITVDAGQITGTLDTNGINAVTVSHNARIGLLDLEETALVTMDTMTDGAAITVANAGIFTQPHASAADWAQYFSANNPGDRIIVQDGALRCKTDYTAELSLDAQGSAFCPVCKQTVVWTPVSGSAHVTAAAGQHYYLTADVVYEDAYDGSGNVSFLSGGTFKNASACFHLNGHNITATQSHGIYGGYGVLNIMGQGTVTGYARGAGYGGAAQINNSVAGNSLNLYSGTYKNAANSVANGGAVAVSNVGGKLCIYEDAQVINAGGVAVYTSTSLYRDTNLEIYGATVQGGISTSAPGGESYNTAIYMDDATVTGEMTVAAGNEAAFNGRTKIGRLTLGENVAVDFTNMKDGSAITVSADGIFSGVMAEADRWLQYLTCADEGDWIIVRDKQFYQEAVQTITAATDDDKTALDTTYAGKTVKYGEMHDHTNSGPHGGYNTGADGNNTLAEWKAEMDRLGMDFATIVDHGQSIHMYYDDWDETYFVGGTEPGTTITDSKAAKKTPHYNMLFSDPADLEALAFAWEDKFKPITVDGYEGYRIKYPTYTTAEFALLAQDVYAQNGLLVHVHPKYDSYIYSDDPLDYYFADYTGLEITTGSGGNMMTKDNEEGYQLWVDLLELGKKIWATSGSDKHRLPNITALTTMYTDADHADTYLAHMRSGNFAPGWVGIRMNVNGTAMGGQTDFSGQRLQFSVGDIYNSTETDAYGTAPAYVEGHTYRVELYDDGGLLMTAAIDPTQLNYFAIDCDETAKFYRIVVWDETDNERIGVSNPIWND